MRAWMTPGNVGWGPTSRKWCSRNELLQVLAGQPHRGVAYDWIWDVKACLWDLPIRWHIEGGALWTLDSGVLGFLRVRVLT